jgi:ssDNA-binding Zn-finger/Zn-ribbon topoisomerase 1
MRTSQGNPALVAPPIERRGPQEENSILPEKKCPWCGRLLVARNGKYGMFIGCSGFPGCCFTKQA